MYYYVFIFYTNFNFLLFQGLDDYKLQGLSNFFFNFVLRIYSFFWFLLSFFSQSYFSLIAGRIVLPNKKRNFRNFSVVFFKKKSYLADPI